MAQLKVEKAGNLEKNILKVSAELFLNQGYENTTIRQIAEMCGIGRGHLYYYFRKKEDILINMFTQIINKIYEDLIENCDNKTEVFLNYATIQCIYIYTLVSNEKLFRIYLEGSKIEIVRRAAQNALSDLGMKTAKALNYPLNKKELYFSIIIGYAGECELLKRFYNNEENFDIDSIVKSVASTRLLLLNILDHKEVENIVNKAIIEAKHFDYNDIIKKLNHLEF